MRLGKALILSGCLFLAACAGQKPAATPPSPDDYVEIPNPTIIHGTNQPETVWVPRSYVESGPKRGSEVVKQGVEKVFPSTAASKEQPAPQAPAVQPPPVNPPQKPAPVAVQQPTAPVSYMPVPAPAAPALIKHRMVAVEVGQNGLAHPLQEQLRQGGCALIADSAQAEYLAQSAALTGPEGKSGFAVRLQQEYNVNEVIFVSAANGVAPGKTVSGEVYDTMGGGLLRSFEAVIPTYPESDQAARKGAVSEALSVIAARVKELVPLLPWYGRISAVNGNRAYIPAGKEAGLRVGQTLKVYHGGKFMKGLGFAPGNKIGTLEVDGFVGPNGAFCAIREGQGIEASDVVAAE